jgi:hypothetical protein
MGTIGGVDVRRSGTRSASGHRRPLRDRGLRRPAARRQATSGRPVPDADRALMDTGQRVNTGRGNGRLSARTLFGRVLAALVVAAPAGRSQTTTGSSGRADDAATTAAPTSTLPATCRRPRQGRTALTGPTRSHRRRHRHAAAAVLGRTQHRHRRRRPVRLHRRHAGEIGGPAPVHDWTAFRQANWPEGSAQIRSSGSG